MKMTYCPYWREECVKDKCSAFELTEQVLFEDKDRQGYEVFTKIKRKEWWYAVDVPYCRTMKIEIPMRPEEK